MTKTIAEAVETAKKADVAILALGESADWMTGEASSRRISDLPGHQEQLLEAVAATGKPVILVMFTGGPADQVGWSACAGDCRSVVPGHGRRSRCGRCVVWRCESFGQVCR
jgi:hypothetical protein